MEVATFGTGCFWCTEAIFKELKGNVFWSVHGSTTLNRQGNDVGTQYRSVIFYHDGNQKEQAEESEKEVEKISLWKNPIVTQIVPFTNFYPAENYHKDYFEKNPGAPYCQLVINPKLQHFREKFQDKLKIRG